MRLIGGYSRAHVLKLPASRLVPPPVLEEAGAREEVHVAKLGHRAVLGDDGPVEPANICQINLLLHSEYFDKFKHHKHR